MTAPLTHRAPLARRLFEARMLRVPPKRRGPVVGLPPRKGELPQLGCRHALLLQGPAGPFMRRFGAELRQAGIRTTKVNFHAGDVLFYPGPDALSFRGTRAEWPGYFKQLVRERNVDAIFLFGDQRDLHRAAIEVARELRIAVWVFEEGYLRPDWITLEQDGVNGFSPMPRDPDVYRHLDLPEPTESKKVPPSFGPSAWYSTLNALTFTHLNGGFPHYEHHRNLNAWFHTASWVRGFVRKQRFAWEERHLLEKLTTEWDGRFFLVPLQVYCDFQIRHSTYAHVEEFLRDVVARFAKSGPKDTALVLKHHPMDRPFSEYGELVAQLAKEHGLEGRLFYCHDIHLPTLLKHARGCITLNSTTGLQSLHHGCPVHCSGRAVYDLPGLTHQGTLEEFLSDPGTFDPDLYDSYRRYLLHASQANGNFYVRVNEDAGPTGIRWFAGI
ncbi:MAG: capsular biosynthesis protein [Sandaracinus sp.]|nr:capsular biosynthesis protein [Sandaracinus sp.]